jgi:hypothetical protein
MRRSRRPFGRRFVVLLLLVMATIGQGVGTIGDLTSDDAARAPDAIERDADTESGADDRSRLAGEPDGLTVVALSFAPSARAPMLARAASAASTAAGPPFGLTVLRL